MSKPSLLMTSSKRSLLVSTARAYNNFELCEIEVCSIIQEEFPDKWEQAVQLLMEYVDDYCPGLEEVTYTDIIRWKLAVNYTERFLRTHGCVIQNKAEITSCALYMANTMNIEPSSVIRSSAVQRLLNDTKQEFHTWIDTCEMWKSFEYPGIHIYYKNGYNCPTSKYRFFHTADIPVEITGMMSHFHHRDTYCDESAGRWRIQGRICGMYFKMYESALRKQITGVSVNNISKPCVSTLRGVEYEDIDELLVTFAVPCKG